MISPKSSTTPKAAQEGLDKKAQQMGATRATDKKDINTGQGRGADRVKNDASSSYRSGRQAK